MIRPEPIQAESAYALPRRFRMDVKTQPKQAFSCCYPSARARFRNPVFRLRAATTVEFSRGINKAREGKNRLGLRNAWVFLTIGDHAAGRMAMPFSNLRRREPVWIPLRSNS
jgi:hypothetical protein